MSETAYAFAYGSLLDPGSLRSTLASAEIGSLVPTKLRGHVRLWNVAFPNDGSQADKAYYDEERRRPPVVLFLNLSCAPEAGPERAANGILVPVSEGDRSRLRRREGRYREVDVSDCVEPCPGPLEGFEPRRHEVIAFVGRDAFTRAEEVGRGVIQRSYLDTVVRGVLFWEERFPGFEAGFRASTRIPSGAELMSLRRVDL